MSRIDFAETHPTFNVSSEAKNRAPSAKLAKLTLSKTPLSTRLVSPNSEEPKIKLKQITSYAGDPI